MKNALLIFNTRLLDSKLDSLGAVLVFDGIIKSIFLGNFAEKNLALCAAKAALSNEKEPFEIEAFDAEAQTLMPSFVDLHSHFRDPGQTQKEDLQSGTKAAAAGGYTHLVLMANTNPVISSAEQAFQNEKKANQIGKGKIFQAISITKNFDGQTIDHLENLSAEKNPFISEDGNDVENPFVMFCAMKKASEKGIVVSCHCEEKIFREKAKIHRKKALELMKKFEIPAWGAQAEHTVPAEINFEIDENLSNANKLLALAEDIATSRNIEIAKAANCHIHIAHCSTKNAIEFVRKAKSELLKNEFLKSENCDQKKLDLKNHKTFNITAEVTPHHLGLVGTEAALLRALVNPPLRSAEDRKALWDAILDGTIDAIATDHAPHTLDDKTSGSPGFSGLETCFSLCYTTLVKNKILSRQKLCKLLSENPAKILGINSGLIEVGKEGNFALVDEKEEWIVESKKFFSKGKATPIQGKRLCAKVKATFFLGKKVFASNTNKV